MGRGSGQMRDLPFCVLKEVSFYSVSILSQRRAIIKVLFFCNPDFDLATLFDRRDVEIFVLIAELQQLVHALLVRVCFDIHNTFHCYTSNIISF